MGLSTSTRIWALAGAGVVLAGVVGATGIWGKARLVHELERVQVTAAAISNHMECDMMHDALRGDVLAIALAESPEGLETARGQLREHADNFRAALVANEKLELDDGVAQSLLAIAPVLESYVAAAERLANEGADKDAVKRDFPAFMEAFTTLEDHMEKVSDQLNAGAASATEHAAATSGRLVTVIAGVMTLGVAFLIAWTAAIRRGIVNPLRACVGAMERVAAGDLSAGVGLDRDDEIGRLARSADQMIERLRHLVGDVAGTAREVAAAATQIAASSEEMATGMQRQEAESNRIADAVRELADSVSGVAQLSDQAATVAGRSREQAGDGDVIVRQTVDEMKAIATEVTQSAESVADLGKKSEQIGRIIGVISDIADQTNLLALNAAIEAARAGEHGRGFAVVADEVRKLAERTMKATSEVAASIREVQEGTNSSVAKIQLGSRRAANGVQLANQAGASLAAIIGESEKVREMVSSIAESTRSQAASGEKVTAGVEQIRCLLRESSAGASQAAEAASSLSLHSTKLQDLVSKFRLKGR